MIGAYREQRLGHANLICGSEGSGALAVALAMAQFLNCENKSGDDSCGVCTSCMRSAKLVHPDVHFIFPVINDPAKKSEKPVSDDFAREWREHILEHPYSSLNAWLEYLAAGNKQGNISVHESASILKKLLLKSFESPFKIVIVWMAELMNPAAANKLLKIFEEPPEGTYFFLISENENKLLLTIRSRMQLYKMAILTDREISEALVLRKNISEKEAARIAMLAAGNYFLAETLAVQIDLRNDWEEMFMEWMRMSFSPMRDFAALLNWIEQLAGKGRNEQKAFLSFCLETARECLMVNYASDLQRIEPGNFPALQKFAPYINANNAEDFVNEINAAISGIERNANAKILFLDLSFRLSGILRLTEA